MRHTSRMRVAVVLVFVFTVFGSHTSVSADPGPARDPGQLVGDPTAPKGEQGAAPALAGEAPRHGGTGKGEPIDGQYIVMFKPGTRGAANLARQLADDYDVRLDYVYENAVQGFAGRINAEKLDGLRRNPNIVAIEQDSVVVAEAVQANATWGLDRIDQRARPLDSSYTYNTTAAGVHAYVIDTGIRLTHSQFTGRIGNGYDSVTSGGNASDCNGHGTHVAGTIGGTTYGVAKQVTLHPVRVLNCSGSGSNAGVIAGIDWVARNHVKPAVANISLGGGASSSLDTALRNMIASGVAAAVAAGNDNANACNYSPARVAEAITVGATTSTDARSSFSNYGTCLDLFAPGSSITSAWYTSDTATNTISGTSMASPHVAGVAALALAAAPQSSAQQVRDTIVNSATTGVVTNPGTGSPNRLLYSLLGAAAPPPPPPPPPGSNVLLNPGFESGPVSWTQSSSGGYALIGTDRPRTGSYGAWLGGYNYATEQISQKVSVPASGRLSYWWRLETAESGSTVYDTLDVRLIDADTGALLATLRRWSNASGANLWRQDTLDVSAYAGKAVHVVFLVRTDSSLASSFFIDDTSLAPAS